MKTMNLLDNTTEDRPQELLSKNPISPLFQANTIPFLPNIPETALTKLMAKAKTVQYLRKEVLGREIYKDNSVVVIFSGAARIFDGDVEKCKEVRIQEPRAGFGEVALLTEDVRATSVVTLEKTVFAVILKRDFKNWLKNYPELKLVCWSQ